MFASWRTIVLAAVTVMTATSYGANLSALVQDDGITMTTQALTRNADHYGDEILVRNSASYSQRVYVHTREENNVVTRLRTELIIRPGESESAGTVVRDDSSRAWSYTVYYNLGPRPF